MKKYINNYVIICKQLCDSIDVIINEKSSLIDRNTANQYIDSIKCNQNILLLLNVSIGLSNKINIESNKVIVYKHFGLQLLEIVMKYNWNTIDDTIKRQIKQLIESWFESNCSSHEIQVNEWRHLMNASSRCVVEVLVREWPQNWPQIMSLLLKTESNFSLYCIWHLSEEIGIFFSPNNCQRRREITNELNNNLNKIYFYINKCLISSDINLCLTSIFTLNVLFDWNQFDDNLLNILIQFCFYN